jgi:hypothetical protein
VVAELRRAGEEARLRNVFWTMRAARVAMECASALRRAFPWARRVPGRVWWRVPPVSSFPMCVVFYGRPYSGYQQIMCNGGSRAATAVVQIYLDWRFWSKARPSQAYNRRYSKSKIKGDLLCQTPETPLLVMCANALAGMIRTRKFSGAAAAFGKAPSSGNVCEYCLTRERANPKR